MLHSSPVMVVWGAQGRRQDIVEVSHSHGRIPRAAVMERNSAAQSKSDGLAGACGAHSPGLRQGRHNLQQVAGASFRSRFDLWLYGLH